MEVVLGSQFLPNLLSFSSTEDWCFKTPQAWMSTPQPELQLVKTMPLCLHSSGSLSITAWSLGMAPA